MDQESAATERSSSEIRSAAAIARACETSGSSGCKRIAAMFRGERERENPRDGNPCRDGLFGRIWEDQRERERACALPLWLVILSIWLFGGVGLKEEKLKKQKLQFELGPFSWFGILDFGTLLFPIKKNLIITLISLSIFLYLKSKIQIPKRTRWCFGLLYFVFIQKCFPFVSSVLSFCVLLNLSPRRTGKVKKKYYNFYLSFFENIKEKVLESPTFFYIFLDYFGFFLDFSQKKFDKSYNFLFFDFSRQDELIIYKILAQTNKYRNNWIRIKQKVKLVFLKN